MKQYMTKAQINDYEKLCHERNNGRLLAPDGLRIICQAYDYAAEKIS